MIKLSFAISTFSGKDEHLDLSLDSLTKHSYDKSSVELLVFIDYVDNKSTRLVLKKYKKFFDSIFVYGVTSKKEAVSHSASRRNFLAIHARGEYIIFCEPEMFHLGNTISELLQYIATHTDKREWLCGPVYAGRDLCDVSGKITDQFVPPPPISKLKPIFKLPKLRTNPTFTKMFSLIDYSDYTTPFFVCMLYRKTFLKLKGLNQNLKVRGYEEIEFANRFKNSGGKIIIYNKISSVHIPHKRNLDIESQISWNLYNSTIDFDHNQKLGKIDDATVQEIKL